MVRRAGLAALLIAGLWLLGAFLQGPSSSSVFLSYQWPQLAGDSVPQPGELPECVSVTVVMAHGWSRGVEAVHQQIDVTGCNDASGTLRLASGPRCSAGTFFGSVPVACSASTVGHDLRVRFAAGYPPGFHLVSAEPVSMAFRITPDGGYFSEPS